MPDSVLLTGLFIGAVATTQDGTKNEKRRLAVAFALPLLVTLTLHAVYNQARFGRPFEFGQRYITQGIDFLHGTPMIRPPADPMLAIFNVGHKVYEYFLSLPIFRPSGALALRYDTVSPYIAGAYTEGMVGVLAWAPIVLFIPIAIWRGLASMPWKRESLFPAVFAAICLAQFGSIVWLISSIPISAFHYALELVPRLALVEVALLMIGTREFTL